MAMTLLGKVEQDQAYAPKTVGGVKDLIGPKRIPSPEWREMISR